MSVGPSCFILIFTKHLQISETLCFISILSKNYSHFILISIPRAIIINALLKANFQERRVIIHTPNDTKFTFFTILEIIEDLHRFKVLLETLHFVL
jgi:hypothetical protein